MNTNPLYEADQVITFYDLIAMRKGFEQQLADCRWYEFRKKRMFEIASGLCLGQLHWLKHGKPATMTACEGDHGQ